MSANIGVVLSSNRLQTTPGGTIDVNLTVRNQSQIVDHFLVKVEGLDPTWWTLNIPTFSLFPGDQGEAKLSLHPPKEAEARAGGYSFHIRVTSQADPTEFTMVDVFLILGGFVSCDIEMSPSRVTGDSGTYGIAATNTGNAEIALIFEARDPEEGLRYKFDNDKITVPAGGRGRTTLTVRPKKGENKKLYSFQVSSTPVVEGKPAAKYARSLGGQLEYKKSKRFPWWIIPLILVLLLALAFVAWKFLFNKGGGTTIKSPPTPTTISTPTPTPTPTPTQTTTPVKPSVVFLSPKGGEKIAVGDALTIEWKSSGTGSASIDLSYSLDGGAHWLLIAAGQPNSGSYKWKTPGTSDKTLIKIDARDSSGKTVAEAISQVFSITSIFIIEPAPLTPVFPTIIPKFP